MGRWAREGGCFSYNQIHCFRYTFRLFSVPEVISMLEDDSSLEHADIFIEAPSVGENTDEDSGEEGEMGTISNLNTRQLQKTATATLLRGGMMQQYHEVMILHKIDEVVLSLWQCMS